MKILFIGAFADAKTILFVNNISRNNGKISFASIKYSSLICEGFEYHVGNGVEKLFLLPVGMYPTSRLLYWKKPKIDNNNYIPFINIILIKQFYIFFYTIFFITKWLLKNKEEENRFVVFGYLYMPFLMAASILKKIMHFQVISFVPDIPEYEFTYAKSTFSLKKILVPIYIGASRIFYGVCDYYVFITKYMISLFPTRPYVIMEGLTNLKTGNDLNMIKDKKAIMYAGALYEKFGINLLLDAFMEISGNYELWLFGSGEMINRINNCSIIDPRIKYFGNLPNNEIIEFEKKAKLLINPRLTNNEYTKYSFPSKLIEYMTSGTPVLTTKLPGIPAEYFDKIFFIETETVEGMRESILRCLDMDSEELVFFGNTTRKYVLTEKNNYKQIEKILFSVKNELMINTQ